MQSLLSRHLAAPRLLAVLLLAACAAVPWLARATDLATIDVNQRGQGVAVAIGGGLKSDHEAVWQRLVALSGGAGSRWVVLGTASEDPMASAAQAVLQLQRRGAQAVALPVSPQLQNPPIAQAVRDEALIALIRSAKGVFFTGGSQDRITDNLLPGGQATPLLQAIWEVYRGGGVVAGTSAGAAIMSSTMFRDAPNVLGVLKGRLTEGREFDRGLGFMGSQLLVDQHFLKRGRIGRLIPLMRLRAYRYGLGVEEDSAALMKGDTVEVIGGRAVFINLVDARSDERLGAFNVQSVRLSLLEKGDVLRLPDGAITPAAIKLKGQLLDPASATYKPYYNEPPFLVDVLGDNVIAVAMGQLIDARYNEVRGIAFDPRPPADDALASQGFEFRLYKGPGSMGWYTDDLGGEDYTVRDLRLDISPIRMALPLYAPWSR